MSITIRTIQDNLQSMKRADNLFANRYVRDVGWLMNRRNEIIEAVEFAIANSHKWTLEDWQNWLTNHARKPLGLAEAPAPVVRGEGAGDG